LPLEKDRVIIATGNMYRKFGENVDVWFLNHSSGQTNRQTNRRTDEQTYIGYRHADCNISHPFRDEY